MKQKLTFAKSDASLADGRGGISEVPHDWLDGPATTFPVWRHTVVLTGSLNAASTPELQEEIECLYQEGVTDVVLDLRALDALELVGAQAVVSLRALYKKRGLAIGVIGTPPSPDRPAISRRDLEALVASPGEPIAPRRLSRAATDGLPARSTKMVKQL